MWAGGHGGVLEESQLPDVEGQADGEELEEGDGVPSYWLGAHILE